MNDNPIQVLVGDSRTILRELPSESVQCCVTSPPYWGLRDYSCDLQLGLEKTPEEYVAKMVAVFGEVRRVLRKDGTLWLNMGDSYAGGQSRGDSPMSDKQDTNNGSRFLNGKSAVIPAGLKPKDLCGIPWRVAFALQADGWWLRSDIIWAKSNPMPESVTDRPTKSHEYIFLLTRSASYFYDAEAIKEKSTENDWQSRLERNSIKSFPTDKVNGIRVRKSDASGINGRNVQNVNSESVRRDEVGSFNNNPNLRPDNGRNKRSVWSIATQPYPEAHFATFPEEIPKLCIMAGTSVGDTVLDPFAGSGTTGMVALELGRKAVLIELNPKYAALIEQRTSTTMGLALA